jgi:cyclase
MVVKGVKFRNHQVVGDIIDLASKYSHQGADEIVFYDITASPEGRRVDRSWVNEVARHINIPFCVAGGIKSIVDAEEILNFGADKISINTPAINQPKLINTLADKFGSQCVVVGIDSYQMNDQYYVYSYTGDPDKTKQTGKLTAEWLKEVQDRGAGEIVLNCINQDGVRKGYDILQLSEMKRLSDVPLIASGGAGTIDHFVDVFLKSDVSGALAASVFHKDIIKISDLKTHLKDNKIEVRL